ncbi:Small heat shock protein OV25-1 [Toxocara canis]|uniref:Small heat shock protein OV25-1 n=1 Tax=Toxocara canis TaxID=6265 RepID=A0A0B2UZH9_TOXCA|nr:Small heat shock protein OV25-1 [Toxocara canis]
MSLLTYYPHSYYRYSPLERSIARVFDDTLREMERPFRWIAPYWLDQPEIQQCNIGNALGSIVNDKEKFNVEIDVTQFRPEELSVNIRDHELIVEGHHEEKSDESGKIERHFIRKYTLPNDAQLDTIESHISDKGILSVGAKKGSIAGPPSRNIPIQMAPREAKMNNEIENKNV